MVERGLREVRDLDENRLSVAGFGFGSVESEEYGFESGEGREGKRVVGVDAREVEGGDEREEGKDDELQVRVGGEVGVVEPLAERVGSGSGESGGEGGGDEGVGGGGGEEGEGGAVGVGEGREGEGRGRRGGIGEERRESVDSRTGFGYGFPPGVHRVRGGGGSGSCGGGGGGGCGGRVWSV